MQRLVIGVIAVLGLFNSAHAQVVAQPRLWIGLDGGRSLAFVVRPASPPGVGLRADVSGWSEGETRPIGTCLACLLIGTWVDAEIRHTVTTIGVGPELNLPIGTARLGIAPQVGLSRFHTKVWMQEVIFFFFPAGATKLGSRTTTKAWAGGGANVALPVARLKRRAGPARYPGEPPAPLVSPALARAAAPHV